MIIVKLQGGLGNQLFQYAFAKKISIIKKQKIYFDISSYDSDYLDRKISIPEYLINKSILTKKVYYKIISKNNKINIFFLKLSLLDQRFENDFSYKPDFLVTEKPITYFDGYWQSHKYFDDIRKEILNQFLIDNSKIKNLKIALEINNSSVAIHVRRTDYLIDSRYGFLGEDYYKKSLQLIKTVIPNPNFLIFSDDIDWCKNNLPFEDSLTYITKEFKLTDFEELCLFSECSNHIIANSTFSWWGAWLSKSQNKIVIRPAKPFNDISLLYEHHYPDKWIAL